MCTFSLLSVGAEGNRRTADVRVKGFTNLFILSKADFESAMSEFPDAHKMLKKRARYDIDVKVECCFSAAFLRYSF